MPPFTLVLLYFYFLIHNSKKKCIFAISISSDDLLDVVEHHADMA